MKKRMIAYLFALGAAVGACAVDDGLDGADGTVGPQGPVGPEGPQGPIGPQGPAGEDVLVCDWCHEGEMTWSVSMLDGGADIYTCVNVDEDGCGTWLLQNSCPLDYSVRETNAVRDDYSLLLTAQDLQFECYDPKIVTCILPEEFSANKLFPIIETKLTNDPTIKDLCGNTEAGNAIVTYQFKNQNDFTGAELEEVLQEDADASVPLDPPEFVAVGGDCVYAGEVVCVYKNGQEHHIAWSFTFDADVEGRTIKGKLVDERTVPSVSKHTIDVEWSPSDVTYTEKFE